MSEVTLTLSREEAWIVYDLVAAKSDLFARAEYEAMQGLGGGPYHELSQKLRVELDRPGGGEKK